MQSIAAQSSYFSCWTSVCFLKLRETSIETTLTSLIWLPVGIHLASKFWIRFYTFLFYMKKAWGYVYVTFVNAILIKMSTVAFTYVSKGHMSSISQMIWATRIEECSKYKTNTSWDSFGPPGTDYKKRICRNGNHKLLKRKSVSSTRTILSEMLLQIL